MASPDRSIAQSTLWTQVWCISVAWFFLLIDNSGGQMVKYFGLRTPFHKASAVGVSIFLLGKLWKKPLHPLVYHQFLVKMAEPYCSHQEYWWHPSPLSAAFREDKPFVCGQERAHNPPKLESRCLRIFCFHLSTTAAFSLAEMLAHCLVRYPLCSKKLQEWVVLVYSLLLSSIVLGQESLFLAAFIHFFHMHRIALVLLSSSCLCVLSIDETWLYNWSI